MTREEAKEIISRHHWSFASMDDEVIEAIECLAEECEDTISFPKGTLKKRGKGYVVYNPEWLKENWRTELRVMGIECEDAISRAWLKEAIHNFYYGLKHTPTEEDIQAYIDVAPSVTPKQKMGRWIREERHHTGQDQEYDYVVHFCSECGTQKRLGWMGVKYCPECGARVEGIEE